MDANTITLPGVLGLSAATPLKAGIDARRGAPLTIDAAQVERVGGLCLQILIAASLAWRKAGLNFALLNASAAFHDDVRLMGGASFLFAEAAP